MFQVVVLAIVQGFTEFLPISSTAHLYLTSWLLGWQTESLDFDIMLHLGTLVSVLIYFFRDWVQIVAHGFGLRLGRDDEPDALDALAVRLAGARVAAEQVERSAGVGHLAAPSGRARVPSGTRRPSPGTGSRGEGRAEGRALSGVLWVTTRSSSQ